MQSESNIRIIGDFLELNADIVNQRETSKLPKFISNIRYNRYHKKLISRIEKFRNSGYVLEKENIAELISYTYNNFPPYGKFNSITASKINDELATEYEMVFKFEGYKVIITIDMKEEGFNVSSNLTQEDGSQRSFNLYIYEKVLFTTDKRFQDDINKFNCKLVNEITDYILSVINNY